MEKMKLLSSQTVPLIQLISQPLQKLQMPDSRKRQKRVEEFELAPEEETDVDAVSDVDVAFE